VRRLPSGGIEFLGRMDRQFKLRGQLVEPDEIEARLLTHPRVMKAAALKRDERLVAFVQCEGAVNEAELRAHAARALPGWMVPQHVAALADWPLTATGKTDMAALRQLPLTMDRRDIVMPRTETEQALWQVWRDILGHDDFGVTDHFFDAGGDSLDVIRLTLAAERAGISFTGNDLAAAGTIARLAQGQVQGDGGLDTAWLKRDVAFDAAFENLLQAAALRPESPLAASRKVLVTGAAGFLAGYVIRELLAQTTAEIHCLARGQDDAAGAPDAERVRVPVQARVTAPVRALLRPGAAAAARTAAAAAERQSHCRACRAHGGASLRPPPCWCGRG
jgi:nonribosomal peptide synthetase DhbF